MVDEITEQLKQICPANDFTISCGVKFKNGAITEPVSLEDILSEENHGSGRISRIEIKGVADNLDNTSSTVIFVDCGLEDPAEGRAVSYKVEADNKDWVFVTSSKLDERIDKVKRFSIKSTGRLPRLLAPPIAGFVGFFLAFGSVMDQTRRALDSVEQRINRGEISDPLTAFLELERARIGVGVFGTSPETTMVMIMSLLVAFALAVVAFINYAYPAYNFCWGDYTETLGEGRPQVILFSVRLCWRSS